MEVHIFRKESSIAEGGKAACRLKMKKERKGKLRTWMKL